MPMNSDERMNRIISITDFYLYRFGRTQIGIFQLATAEPNPSWFFAFINTLMVTLRRRNVMPYNFWVRDESGGRFILILWGSGYFRNDLSDIAPIVERFWALHSPEPVVVLGSFSLSSAESSSEELLRFNQTAQELIGCAKQASAFRHQRSFGGSLIR